jgi:hypothetical protein
MRTPGQNRARAGFMRELASHLLQDDLRLFYLNWAADLDERAARDESAHPGKAGSADNPR